MEVAGGAAVKERPILFNAEMVRAILDGRKTQTRRVVKPQPDFQLDEMCNTDAITGWQIPGHSGIWDDDDATGRKWKCPFGTPGDRLWVREAWADTSLLSRKQPVSYRADWTADEELTREFSWRPSIHMPRWASRITLKVVNVRVERLHDISPDDCRAEGVYPEGIGSDYADMDAYRKLWESTYGHGSWDANPWVWAIEFRLCAKCRKTKETK